MSRWFAKQENGEVGPSTIAELRAMAQQGALRPEGELRREDSEVWSRADSVPGVFASEDENAAPPTATRRRLPPDLPKPDPPVTPAQSAGRGLNISIPSAAEINTLLQAAGRAWLQQGWACLIADVGKWACLAIALLFCLAALSAGPAGVKAAGIACFFGICARICQAEQHSRK